MTKKKITIGGKPVIQALVVKFKEPHEKKLRENKFLLDSNFDIV